MKEAIIGYTGFVGSNINSQHEFDDQYNSKNIEDIADKFYDLIVSAGARAEKWRINQEPEKDLAEIDGLIRHLKTVKTRKFVLISTIDVYKNPVDVDEDTKLDKDSLHAYGANRIHLEEFVQANFDSLVVRLPGLFGPGLKKNVIYDFLNDNNLDKIHHAGSLQYYNLESIWQDINKALSADLKIINFATAPIRTDELAAYAFGIKDFKNEPEGVTAGTYDMHTKHASAYGKDGVYLYDKQQVLEDIKNFVKRERQ
jgi:nucleoside-diphosphate-sugar epimerase